MNKEEMKNEAQSKLERIKEEMAVIELKLEKTEGKVEDIIKQNIKDSREKVKILETKLEGFKDTTEEKSKDLMDSFNESSIYLMEAINKITAAFK